MKDRRGRVGRLQFGSLGNRIRALQNEVMARRRSIQRGGRAGVSGETARSGHGRKRKLLPTEKLQKRIERAYSTLNHQLSHCVIEFAKNNGAGVIQIENLKGLKDELRGTFIGQNWRYNQLQNYIKYKAEEAGIEVREVNPFYTSRRCSKCGFIHKDFTFKYRQANKKPGKAAMFECPECGYKKNADYNAARNLATLDIENKICLQCKEQGIEYKELQRD